MRLRARSTLAALLLVLLVGGCRPLYLPLAPEPPPYEPGTRITSFEAGLNSQGRPVLELSLMDVSEPAWLAVQWLGPSGREIASESAWVEPGAGTVIFVLPADVNLTAGEWRAVVSLGGRLLRQFTFVVA